ncbi:hypothetical protein [Nitratireductor sp. XY-223]|uniref:hypothetical protein n=1 Tax=Nitratireductor sp. XY-223 TaxID=2561926 RepID=UPI0010AB0A0F|nr:hypothetical protein [Nitratireductor sp. XY-223]
MLNILIREIFHLTVSVGSDAASVTDRNRAETERHMRWRRDPLSHPDIQAMTATELGDLPFDARRILGTPPVNGR